MVKTLLIPTDFTVESLNTLKLALEKHKHEQVSVVLFHAERLSDSITELLFYSPAKALRQAISGTFSEAVTILKNTYESSAQAIHVELFHGTNVRAFVNFATSHKTDLIYIPKNYRLKIPKKGIDPIPLIKQSHLSFEEIDWTSENKGGNGDQLHQLFN